MKHIEYISDLCITREKLIDQTLPKNPNILDYLEIIERGLYFLYHRLGDLRTYLRDHKASGQIRHCWIKNAIDAIHGISWWPMIYLSNYAILLDRVSVIWMHMWRKKIDIV